MASHHHLQVVPRPRTIANILIELKQARDDWTAALNDDDDPDWADRQLEAEQRTEELRAEFATMFEAANGVPWKQVELAISELLL